MQTLQELLEEHRAVAGDKYAACGSRWHCVADSANNISLERDDGEWQLVSNNLAYVPAAGWTRLYPTKPVTVVRWINIYEAKTSEHIAGQTFNSRHLANQGCVGTRKALVRLTGEYEEEVKT